MKKVGSMLFALLLMTFGAAPCDPADLDTLRKTGLEPFAADRFISPDVCGRCHEDIFEMWDGTMHSGAFDDPLFIAATKLFVRTSDHPGEREDAEHCVSCHNPIAYRSGQITGSSDDYEKTDDVTKRAISCDLCHSINEVVRTENASFNTDPGHGEDDPGTKRGPRDDAVPLYHEAAFSKIHTSSELCGTCHNVTHLWYLTKLEGTYDEWYHSPYNSADPEGKPTINVTEAAVMLSDHRIQPKGWIDETFVFGKNIKKPFTVHAALKYRSMKPSLVRVLLGGRDYDVPVIIMAEIEKTYQ